MNGHGGRREGSGRKKLSEKHAQAIEDFTSLCASHAKPAFYRLWELIDTEEVVEKHYRIAGLVTRKEPVRDKDGDVILDDKGKPTLCDVKVFPDTNDQVKVFVGSKETKYPADVRAIKEVVERFMGKAMQAIELSNGDDGPLKIELVFADPEPPDISDANDPGLPRQAARGPEEDPSGE